MYLKKTPTKSGKISLSAVQGYRDNGRVRQRTVQTFGFVDELQKEYPDPILHFTQVVAEMDKQRLAQDGPQMIAIHPLQQIDKRTENRKEVGDAIPLAYYNALNIESAIRSNMRGHKTDFDVNALLRLLVAERLLHPGSKHAAFMRAKKHFYRCEVSESDVYRGLGELARMKEQIISKMNVSLAQAGIRDLSLGFYDVTNYYFESDGDELRRKGVSKEHKPNPLVQMGLMQDANGIPVSFNIFAGNTHDDATLIDALSEAKRATGMKRIVVVADKGINTSCNIAATVAKGDGFVFSQSVRGTKSNSELKKWVLSEKDYKIQDNGEFKIKSRQDTKTISVQNKDSYDGHTHKADVDIKVVAFWSKKYAERARRERERVLAKAQELVRCPGKYSRATHLGAAKYVKNIELDANTGEVLTNPNIPEIDWDIVEAESELDGYYCIITSETTWSDEKILDTYRELWRIEETFKLSKSLLKSRPVYVWTPEHIKAHFLTCYIALSIERIIEHALGHNYGAGAILEDLRAMCCSNIDTDWWLFDHRTDLTDELFALIGEKTPKKYMRTQDIKALFLKNKQVCWKKEKTHNKK